MSSPILPHAKLDWTISKFEETVLAEPENLDARLKLAQCMWSRGWMHEGGEADCAAAPPRPSRRSHFGLGLGGGRRFLGLHGPVRSG